jgi:hypothetical protein
MHDEWQSGDRHYLSEDSMAILYPERDTALTAALTPGDEHRGSPRSPPLSGTLPISVGERAEALEVNQRDPTPAGREQPRAPEVVEGPGDRLARASECGRQLLLGEAKVDHDSVRRRPATGFGRGEQEMDHAPAHVIGAQLDLPIRGVAEAPHDRFEQGRCCAGVRREELEEPVGGYQHDDGILDGDDAGGPSFGPFIDGRQLADEVARPTPAEHDLAPVRSGAYDLDVTSHYEDDMIASLALAQEGAALAVMARHTEASQGATVVLVELLDKGDRVAHQRRR